MPVEETLAKSRVVLVTAHPDDETIGAGGLLARLDQPFLVIVTNGSPPDSSDARANGFERNEDYAAARREELRNALALAGIRDEQLLMLNMADQSVSLNMADLARRIAGIFTERRPSAVLTHPYEGGHPDHDACAFAVHAACAMISPPPDIYEFASYHAGPGGHIETGRFLPHQDHGEVLVLSAADVELKQRMVQSFATQAATLSQFPLDTERFRPAPAYDLTEAPHAGQLFYEQFNWGMTGDRWRLLATEAMRELGLSGAL